MLVKSHESKHIPVTAVAHDVICMTLFIMKCALITWFFSHPGMSRALRSYPAILKEDAVSTPAKEVPEQELLLVGTVESNQVLLSGNQNHTPDYQRVEQSDSESGVNSNSSGDFPTPGQSDLKSDGALSESHRNSAASPVIYDSQSKTKEPWIEQKPTSVIIQQHRSDEM